MTRRALVIAPQPFFSNRGTPLSVYYRTLVMAELGVSVDLITYGEGQDVDIPNLRIIRIPRFAWLGNVKVGPSYLKLFLDIFVTLHLVRQLLVRRYDFVHAHEEAIFICRFLKPLFRFRLVYDIHSNLAQQLTNTRFTRSKLLKVLFSRLQESCIRVSDAVITICPDLADYVNTVHDGAAKNILIENSIFDPVRVVAFAAGNSGAREQSPPAPGSIPADRQIILYAGTLENYQGIELLLNAFRETRLSCADAFLLVVGGTEAQVHHYSGLAHDLAIDQHVLLLGNRPQKEIPGYMERAAVLVSPRIEGTNTPLKLYQQIASGIPLVATDIESHTQVLDDSVAFLPAPEPKTYAQAIIQVLNQRDAAAEKASRARQLYAEKYSRASYTEKMRRVLAMVV
jgi:glycosyltransferase involved in cell wall biosynthesis